MAAPSSRIVLAAALAALSFVSFGEGATHERGVAHAREAVTVPGRGVAAPQPPPKRRHVVGVIGDSLTDRRSGGARYVDALAKRCPESRFDPYGIGGQRVGNMRDRFAEDLFAHGKPAYTDVILLGGVNDLLGHAKLDEVERDVAAMLRMAHARGVRVVVLTIPVWPGATAKERADDDRYDRFLLDRAKVGEADAAIDLRPLLDCDDEAGAVCTPYRRTRIDGVHWSQRGHEIVGDALWKGAFADCL